MAAAPSSAFDEPADAADIGEDRQELPLAPFQEGDVQGAGRKARWLGSLSEGRKSTAERQARYLVRQV